MKKKVLTVSLTIMMLLNVFLPMSCVNAQNVELDFFEQEFTTLSTADQLGWIMQANKAGDNISVDNQNGVLVIEKGNNAGSVNYKNNLVSQLKLSSKYYLNYKFKFVNDNPTTADSAFGVIGGMDGMLADKTKGGNFVNLYSVDNTIDNFKIRSNYAENKNQDFGLYKDNVDKDGWVSVQYVIDVKDDNIANTTVTMSINGKVFDNAKEQNFSKNNAVDVRGVFSFLFQSQATTKNSKILIDYFNMYTKEAYENLENISMNFNDVNKSVSEYGWRNLNAKATDVMTIENGALKLTKGNVAANARFYNREVQRLKVSSQYIMKYKYKIEGPGSFDILAGMDGMKSDNTKGGFLYLYSSTESLDTASQNVAYNGGTKTCGAITDLMANNTNTPGWVDMKVIVNSPNNATNPSLRNATYSVYANNIEKVSNVRFQGTDDIAGFFELMFTTNRLAVNSTLYLDDFKLYGKYSLNVVNSDVENNSNNVALDKAINITFDSPLDVATLTPENVFITKDGSSVLSDITLSSDKKTVTIKPKGELTKLSSYVLTLNTAIQSSDNLYNLKQAYILKFHTQDKIELSEIMQDFNDGKTPQELGWQMSANETGDYLSIENGALKIHKGAKTGWFTAYNEKLKDLKSGAKYIFEYRFKVVGDMGYNLLGALDTVKSDGSIAGANFYPYGSTADMTKSSFLIMGRNETGGNKGSNYGNMRELMANNIQNPSWIDVKCVIDVGNNNDSKYSVYVNGVLNPNANNVRFKVSDDIKGLSKFIFSTYGYKDNETVNSDIYLDYWKCVVNEGLKVGSTIPTTGATEVLHNSNVVINFNRAIDDITVTKDKFVVMDSKNNSIDFSHSITPDKTAVTITFASNLNPNETYTVKVLPGIKSADADMGAMVGEYAFSFKTKDADIKFELISVKCEGNDVTSLLDSAGKNIDISMKLTNNAIVVGQEYSVIVTLVGEKGKIRDLEVLSGNVAKGESKLLSYTMAIPRDMTANHRIKFFIWQSTASLTPLINCVSFPQSLTEPPVEIVSDVSRVVETSTLMWLNNTKILSKGVEKSISAPYEKGTIMLPFESTAQSLNLDCAVVSNSYKLSNGIITISGNIESCNIKIEDKIFKLSVAPTMQSGEVFVSSELFNLMGFNMDKDEDGLIILGNVVPSAEIRNRVKELFGVYVSENGNDLNNGFFSSPVQTLNKAKQISRITKQQIYMRGGTYNVNDTISFTALDNNIRISAYNGEKVDIKGSKTIDKNSFSKIQDIDVLNRLQESAREKVLCADLTKYIDTIDDCKPVLNAGTSYYNFVVNDKIQELAKYPNTGYLQTGTILDNGDISGKPKFKIGDERATHWTNSKNMMAGGYWGYDYYFEQKSIDSVDAGIITLSKKPSYKINQNARYLVYNLIEELDAPKEWYIDKTNKKLYYYPESNIESAEISIMTKPLISLNGCQNVSFENINLKNVRGNAVEIADCDTINILGCQIINIGNTGINVNNSKRITIKSCDISNIGGSGIYLNGGNTAMLNSADYLVENCVINDFAQIYKTYSGAVDIHGVGTTVTKNKIFNSPHLAIRFEGNNQIISNNEIFDVVKETADSGAIYCGRSWTGRGCKIESNYLHDIVTNVATHDYLNANAIYVDDLYSAVSIRKNIIDNAGIGMLIGGGRENKIENNLIINSQIGLRYDARGKYNGFSYSSITDGGVIKKDVLNVYNDIKYNKVKWETMYPEFNSIVQGLISNDKNVGLPKNCVISRNLYCSNKSENEYVSLESEVINGSIIENNLKCTTLSQVGLENYKNSSEIFVDKISGFELIKFSDIGIYKDNYR